MINHRQILSLREDCLLALKSAPDFSALKNETILIIGGSGFMGSWLLEMISALNENHSLNISVIVLSRNASKLNTEKPHLANMKGLTLIDSNITDMIEIPSQVRWVIHAAGSPDNRVHVSNPIRIIQETIDGTQNALSCSVRLPDLRKFLYVSSGQIYGSDLQPNCSFAEDWHSGPSTETALSAYPESKRLAETLCYSFKGLYRIPISVIRPFAFIGPYQLLDRPWAINNFLRDAFLGNPIRILGNDQTTRSYMYPSEMAVWILTVLINGPDGRSYNLGASDPVTLRKAAETVAAYSTKQSGITMNSTSSKAPMSCFIPDISRAKQELGLTLNINWEEAIKKTIDWHSL